MPGVALTDRTEVAQEGRPGPRWRRSIPIVAALALVFAILGTIIDVHIVDGYALLPPSVPPLSAQGPTPQVRRARPVPEKTFFLLPRASMPPVRGQLCPSMETGQVEPAMRPYGRTPDTRYLTHDRSNAGGRCRQSRPNHHHTGLCGKRRHDRERGHPAGNCQLRESMPGQLLAGPDVIFSEYRLTRAGSASAA